MKKQIRRDTRQDIRISEQLKTVDVGVKSGTFVFSGPMTVAEFMHKIGKNPAELIKKYFMKGTVLTLNTVLKEEQIGEICFDYGLDFKVEDAVTRENVLEKMAIDDSASALRSRAPVVTIMGHVDHGKTTLLDAIRKTNVVKGEAGGITQRIGAYQIVHKGKPVTFIDTPGHEAFSKMRARGADVTDIIVLVVSADDGVMPQTQEAIDHARQAKVPLIVFVNKMDKPTANPDKVMGDLAGLNVVAEEYQGDVPFVQGSALKGKGLDELLETIALVWEVNEKKANYDRLANGTIIESHLDRGLGPTASLIVQGGTLRKGDFITAGFTYGRVRTLNNDKGQSVNEAIPGMPVTISGLLEVPGAGDKFVALHDEKEAKELAELRKSKAAVEQRSMASISEELRSQIESGALKALNLVVKADSQGSLEAIRGAVSKIDISGTHVQVIRAAVGPVSETDIMLAAPAKALIFAFNLKTANSIVQEAEKAGVVIKQHDVIYRLLDEIKELLTQSKDKEYESKTLGKAEVVQLWKHSSVGTICGSRVISGKVSRNAKARLWRKSEQVYDGEIASMKHLKDDVKEVVEGKECGIVLRNFENAEPGDIIEAYELVLKG